MYLPICNPNNCQFLPQDVGFSIQPGGEIEIIVL